MSGTRMAPQYCPYCADSDLRPERAVAQRPGSAVHAFASSRCSVSGWRYDHRPSRLRQRFLALSVTVSPLPRHFTRATA